MIKIHNLNRPRELLLGEAPDPRGAIPDLHLLLRPVPTATIGFAADPSPQGFGRFDRSGVGGRGFLAHRSAPRIDSRLREDTTQFHLARASLLALFPWPCFGLRTHHRHPRP